MVPERVHGDDVRLLRDHGGLGGLVPLPALVAADSDVTEGPVVAHVLLEGLDLEDSGAPPGAGARKEAAVDLVEPDVERVSARLLRDADQVQGVQVDDLLAQDGFEASQVLIGLGELATGVAEDVLDLQFGIPVPQVEGQRSRVLPTRHAYDVPVPVPVSDGHGVADGDHEAVVSAGVADGCSLRLAAVASRRLAASSRPMASANCSATCRTLASAITVTHASR